MKVSDFDSWLKGDLKRHPVMLIYGPDQGLVHERVQRILDKTVSADDPFQFVRLDGDEIAGDPLRLTDEANTIGLFGGMRVIHVRLGAKQFAPALAPVLANPPLDALVLIEAGDLKKTAPIVTACDKSPAAAVIICYADESRQISALIKEMLTDTGLAISADAQRHLSSILGANRALSRSEIEKLALYCAKTGRVTDEDIDAVVSNVAALEPSALIDAAFLGDFPLLETFGERLFCEGLEPGVAINAALRHAILLKRLLDLGQVSKDAFEQVARSNGVYYKRFPAIERQMRAWKADRATKAIAQASEAVALIRRTPRLGTAIASRALWSIALAANRTG